MKDGFRPQAINVTGGLRCISRTQKYSDSTSRNFERNHARHRSLRSFQMSSANRPATRLATRLSFLVAGFGIACWTPLVPFAKQRLGLDDGTLGLLLLCIGIGSVVAMLLTGPLSSRYGSKPVILAGGVGRAVILPVLSVAATPTT